eukprot:6490089-Amphidinium_carterae.2
MAEQIHSTTAWTSKPYARYGCCLSSNCGPRQETETSNARPPNTDRQPRRAWDAREFCDARHTHTSNAHNSHSQARPGSTEPRFRPLH